MKPAERVEAVLKGEMVDKVPFTIYECMLSQCEVERSLRNQGLCIINRRFPVYKSVSPNVKEESIHFTEDGVSYVKTMIKTPQGNLSRIRKQTVEWISWSVEKIFKTSKDYDAIEFMIMDRQYVPNYEPFVKAKKWMRGDIFLRANVPNAPMHQIIYNIMGVETFSIEWTERRKEIMRLCDALTEEYRKVVQIAARSPAMAINLGGNFTPEVLGKERFVKYVIPYLNECAEVLHQGGKLVGSHLDANNKLWAKEIANSKLDYIEAFTPAPDTDMTVAEARKIWKGKILWMNFPSSVHLKDADFIEEITKKILKEAVPGDKFLIGITEDVPEDRWQESFLVISKTIEKYGKLPL
jgi:hypothetical protein